MLAIAPAFQLSRVAETLQDQKVILADADSTDGADFLDSVAFAVPVELTQGHTHEVGCFLPGEQDALGGFVIHLTELVQFPLQHSDAVLCVVYNLR